MQICTICTICNLQNMPNMPNMQDKYSSIFLKNMLKYDEHPDGILDPVRVFVIFYDKHPDRILDPVRVFVIFCIFFKYMQN
jgi:hypothetical protein